MKHCEEILSLLQKQIKNTHEVNDIKETALKVAEKWVHPTSGGKEEINGLIYGLVQSGKTGVLTVTGAIAADEGYRTLIVLTSDNDTLYDQTLGRVQEAFPGIDIIGKQDFKDTEAFIKRIKGGTSAIVTTKNHAMLGNLLENFKKGRVRGLSCLIIDDEADQASLNTKAKRADGSRSTINARIVEIRGFFDKNTYLQVTATPQALFLQPLGHEFRPKFTVLSHPGSDYVGGEDFFGDDSQLVREFPAPDISVLAPGSQPSPSQNIPASLLKALDTFMIGATYKRMLDPEHNSAFLCHVSTKTGDHRHIVNLLRKYKSDLPVGVKARNPNVIKRLKSAFDDLATTHAELKESDFEKLLERIEFYSPGITVKLVNKETDEDVALKAPYNLFVGGNKLGRGVTIKNLLVSYYGRNPKSPQADTVLQHARMYGYRRKDIGLLRLFLPPLLHTVFRAINKMEGGLRDLIERNPIEDFRGIFVQSGISPTRKNVLAPGSLGVYAAGSSINPAQVLRTAAVKQSTEMIDKKVASISNQTYAEMSISAIQTLIFATMPDEDASELIWNPIAVSESFAQFAKIHKQKEGYVYVDRDRELNASRRETQGVLSGGEVGNVPADKVTLFLLRTKAHGKNSAAWWPQVRFPTGNYAFSFAV